MVALQAPKQRTRPRHVRASRPRRAPTAPRTTDAGLRTRKPVEGRRRHSQGGACANLRDRPLSTLRNSARARRLRSPIYKSTLRLSSIVSTRAKREPQAQEKRQGGAYKRRGGQNTTRSQSCSPFSLSFSHGLSVISGNRILYTAAALLIKRKELWQSTEKQAVERRNI